MAAVSAIRINAQEYHARFYRAHYNQTLRVAFHRTWNQSAQRVGRSLFGFGAISRFWCWGGAWCLLYGYE